MGYRDAVLNTIGLIVGKSPYFKDHGDITITSCKTSSQIISSKADL